MVRPNAQVQPQACRSETEAGPSAGTDGWALISRNLDVFNLALWAWNRQAVFSEPRQVKLNGFSNLLLCFFDRLTGRNAAGKIRNVCRVV